MNTSTNTNNKYRILKWSNLIKIIAIVGIYLLVDKWVKDGTLNRQYTSILVPMGTNIMLAVSLSLVTGFLGELSLGHAGFMSLGVFSGTLFTINANLPRVPEFILAIIIGGLVAAIFGFLIGIPVLRLKGDYLAIVTLAFGEIVRSVIEHLKLPMGKAGDGKLIMKQGAMGVSGIPSYSNYTWVYVFVIITIFVCANVVKSRHGRMITSIRDNHIAAESIGIHVSRYKIMAFTLAAFFAGVAGVLYGHNYSIIKPSIFDYNRSINILVFVVLGGMGSIPGAIIAAVILTILPEKLRDFEDYRMLMYAVLLIVMMIFNSSSLKRKIIESDKFTRFTNLFKFGNRFQKKA